MVPMANPLVEGMVPLEGIGFVPKKNGNFLPGEYKRLCNAEISPEGGVVNRRNMNSVFGETADSYAEAMSNPQRFIGSMGEYSIVGLGEYQVMVGSSTFQYLWDLTALGPAGAASYSQFLGFFRYNNKNFWLVFEFNSGISVSLVLYHDADIPVPDLPETYAAGYEAGLVRTEILNFGTGTTDFYEFQFKNFFIYKERLWIATTVGLYFSAATDPTNFVVPDGGFFKHPGNRVNYALAIKDNIYTLCDDAVYALTYSTDPNLDSTERPLSDTIGGEMGCVHLDTVYFINNQGIYVINGNNVDKVMDSRFDYGQDSYENQLWSFEDYLIVNKYLSVNYDNNYSPPARVTTRKNLIASPESDAVGGTQIISGWTASGSPDVLLRTNAQGNSNVVLAPQDGGYTDYFASSPASVIGRDAVLGYAEPGCGYVRRASATGVASCAVNNFYTVAGPSEDWTLSMRVNFPGTSRNINLRIFYADASTATIGTSDYFITVSSDGWQRISRTVTTPVGTAYIWWQLEILGLGGTENHYFDTVLFEKSSSLKDYFDGEFPDDSFRTYSWDSTQYKSYSRDTIKTAVMNAISAYSDGISTGKVLRYGGTFVNGAYTEGTAVSCWGKLTKTFTFATALENGLPYTFKFDYKGAGSWSSGVLTATFEYLDAANVVKGSSTHTVASPFNPSSSYASFRRDTIVFPTGSTKLKVTFTFTFDVSGTTTTTPWNIDFNKFHLEKASTYSGYFTGATTDTVDVAYSWTGTAFASESTTGSATSHSYLKNNGKMFEPFLGGNTLGYNTYFINTLNGAVHTLDFYDQDTDYAHGSAGFLVDALVNPYSDESGNDKIFFLTNKLVEEDESGLDFHAYVYYMSSSESNVINDYVVDSTATLRRRAPKIDIEIDSYVPDGFEHKIKKFRSLLLQGVLPPVGMQLETAYNNNDVYQITTLGDDESVLSQPRRHYSHRIGLNQRGNSITFRLRNPEWDTPLTGTYGPLEISDLRLLWTYIQRFATTRNIGS